MKVDPIVARLIERYALKPHPEGGYYAETYRSADALPAGTLPRFGGARPASTAIYFLLQEGSKSSLHRIKSDEVWHFYLGGPLTIVQISAEGKAERVRLGPAIEQGETLQHVVPAGCWFGAYPYPGARFSFVGCTVAPGFDFEDFELGRRAELLARFPAAKAEIERLTSG